MSFYTLIVNNVTDDYIFDHDSNVQSATLTMKLRINRAEIKTQLKMIFNDFNQ